jgi:hypothetical protein
MVVAREWESLENSSRWSSRDYVTINEALGVRLGPRRRRSGILIVKVIVTPP